MGGGRRSWSWLAAFVLCGQGWVEDAQGSAPAKRKRAANTEPNDAPEYLEFPGLPAERWSKHFSVVEVTPGGRTLPLKSDAEKHLLQFVDLHSKIFINRKSTEPTVIKSREQSHRTSFGVKVQVWRDDCPRIIGVAGLNSLHATKTTTLPGCKAKPTTYNFDVDIGGGESFQIDTLQLQQGDTVHVKLMGDYTSERQTTMGCSNKTVRFREGKKLGEPTEQQVCSSTLGPVPGTDDTVMFTVVDFRATKPYEWWRNREWMQRTARGERFDLDTVLAVSPWDPSNPPTSLEGAIGELIVVHATVKRGDADPKIVDCPINNGHPSCNGFNDGDLVALVVNRPLTVDGRRVDEEVARYELEAAALGLHFLPAGNRRAYYSTASVLAVEQERGQDSRLTFAQTFAYSLYWKHRRARWIEAFSLGAHFAILGNPRDEEGDPIDDATTDDEGLVSFGIGGQLGFGWDALQVGAGYDFLTERRYFLVGIGVPDAVNAIAKLRNRK